MKKARVTLKPGTKQEVTATNRFESVYSLDRTGSEVEQRILKMLAGMCLPDSVDMGYLIDLSHEPLTKALETHINSCNKCKDRYNLLKERRLNKMELDLDIPGIVEKDKDHMISDETLTLILKSTSEYLELVEHTGIVVPDVPGQGIGTYNKERKDTVIVRKDLPSCDLAVHVAVSGEFSASHGEARLFAMKPNLKEYIGNLNVSLTGEGLATQRSTDEHGRAKFPDMKQGKYEIWSGDKLLARIIIK